jgi:hypothetical protein
LLLFSSENLKYLKRMGDIKNAIKKLQTASKNIKFDFGSNLKE